MSNKYSHTLATLFIIDKTENYPKCHLNKWMDKQIMIYPLS